MPTISRRSFVTGASLGVTAMVTGLGTTLLTSAARAQSGPDDRLVLIFLAGGADGLTIAPPYGHSSYYDHRPTLAVPAPGAANGALELTAASSNNSAVFPTGLDGTVGLHPSLKPLHDTLWKSGNLAVMPMVGIPELSRSHFSAQKWFHHGGNTYVRNGSWLGRAVEAKAIPSKYTSLYNTTANELLDGTPGMVGVINSLDKFSLTQFDDGDTALNALEKLYDQSAGSAAVAGRRVISGIRDMANVDAGLRQGYPRSEMGRALSEVATLFSAFPGIRVAGLRFGGWDHHANMGAGDDPNGKMSKMLANVAESLNAFSADTDLNNITVMVVTEFGRTINENSSGGTDHGTAGTFMAMGSGIQGGVFGRDYPDQLVLNEGLRGDSPILTDFREAIYEILGKRFGIDPSAVFPQDNFGNALGLTR